MEKASNIVLLIILACILFILVFRVVDRSRKGMRLPIFYSLFILLLPFVGIYIGILLINYDFLTQWDKLFCMVKLLIVDFLLIYVDLYVVNLWRDRNNLYFQFMNDKYSKEEAKAVTEQLKSIKIIRHDLKNHFIYLQALIGRGKIEEAEQYLNSLMIDKLTDDHTITGNPAFDTILSAKYNEAHSLGIQVKFDAVIPNTLPIEFIDITTIIGNAMDNAIRAAAEIEKERRIIDVSLYFRHNCLSIKVKNPYNEILKKNAINFLTTKSDKENHGIGLYSLRQSVKKYNGWVNTDHKNLYFELTVILCVNTSI